MMRFGPGVVALDVRVSDIIVPALFRQFFIGPMARIGAGFRRVFNALTARFSLVAAVRALVYLAADRASVFLALDYCAIGRVVNILIFGLVHKSIPRGRGLFLTWRALLMCQPLYWPAIYYRTVVLMLQVGIVFVFSVGERGIKKKQPG